MNATYGRTKLHFKIRVSEHVGISASAGKSQVSQTFCCV